MDELSEWMEIKLLIFGYELPFYLILDWMELSIIPIHTILIQLMNWKCINSVQKSTQINVISIMFGLSNV